MFTIAVLAAIALSPTQLKFRFACALSVLLLPTDSEAFGTSAYAFWWGSLLAILPLLWQREGRQYPLLRSGLLVLGALSSPLIIVLSPLYAVRAVLQRTWTTWCDLVIVALTAGLQYYFLAQTAQAGNTAFQSITPFLFIRKFFGFFIDI